MATIQYIVIPALFLAKNTFQAHWGQGIKVTFLLRALRVFWALLLEPFGQTANGELPQQRMEE